MIGKVKHNAAYRVFADEATAKASVYDYLYGKSFINSREDLLSALRELATMPAPVLTVFDQDRFVRSRLEIIDGLLKEFDESSRTD